MTVTFRPVEAQPTAWEIQCACGSTVGATVYADRDAAVVDLHTVVCPDDFCASHHPYIHGVSGDNAPSLNVGNANARALLGLLGLDGEDYDLCGSADATDLLGRVLIAVAVEPADAGRPSTTTGIMTDCGRPEGYFEDRLAELRTICGWAAERGIDVVWS